MYIKGFDKDLKCRGFQFEVGKEYKIENNGKPLELCSDTVFHFCDSLQKVHSFYGCDNETNRYCIIEPLGEIVSSDDKCGSDYIRVVREICGDELRILKGLTNNNTGLFNSGNWNSGNWNSGDGNSGNRNSGNWNSGNRNSGNRNSGNWNSGDGNSGNGNSGNGNSGYRNSCDYSNGVFCNESDMNIRIFNRPSGMSLKDFYNSRYYDALTSEPLLLTELIEYTQEEKQNDKDKEMIGYWLKEYSYKEASKIWWDKLTVDNKKIIQEIPNFDAEVFYDITGIRV